MASSTPDGDPTHSTYEVNVPLRNGHDSSSSPNPEIRIPRIKPVEDDTAPKPPEELAAGLEGKYVDEFGNILDWDGTVLGRVEGDLPSMVGRPVEASGEVKDEEGEVAGKVCESYITPGDDDKKPELKPLGGGLQVDDEGNIYDDEGNAVGKLNKPPAAEGSKDKEESGKDGQSSAPKPAVAPRPDELYLDVKSTFDGIQLIIKIPTVFNRDRGGPENRGGDENR
ncbi:hypothetical protein ACJZ2D_001262 [Fusarium nematophilum]